MAWSIESVREASLTPADVFRLYADPSTWGSWGHNTRWARADGPLVECEVHPPGMLVVNTYEVQPIGDRVRIRRTIAVSGRSARVLKLAMMDKLYTRLLAKETRRLVELAARLSSTPAAR